MDGGTFGQCMIDFCIALVVQGAFIGAWRNALQQIQQQRRSQTILQRALRRSDALAPEVLRLGMVQLLCGLLQK